MRNASAGNRPRCIGRSGTPAGHVGWRDCPRIVGRTGETLHAPHLIDLEVLQAVRRFVRSDQLTPARAAQALDDFAALRVQRYGHLALARRIWELRENATAYEAAYLALAEALPGTLLTCDAALASVPGVYARVEVV